MSAELGPFAWVVVAAVVTAAAVVAGKLPVRAPARVTSGKRGPSRRR